MLEDNIYMQEQKFQWEDEHPVRSLCAPATAALPNLARDGRADGGGDRGAGRRSDRRPEEGTEEGTEAQAYRRLHGPRRRCHG
jgi:hypothetical protein